MKKPVSLMLALAALSQAASVTSSEVQHGKTDGISFKVLERSAIAGTDEELRMMLIELPPGFSAIKHVHPVFGLCYVLKGTAESQYEGEDVKTFRAGNSYQDLPVKKHLLYRNVSKTNVHRFVCTAKMKKDQPYLYPL